MGLPQNETLNLHHSLPLRSAPVIVTADTLVLLLLLRSMTMPMKIKQDYRWKCGLQEQCSTGRAAARPVYRAVQSKVPLCAALQQLQQLHAH